MKYFILAVLSIVIICVCYYKKPSEKFSNQSYLNPASLSYKIEKPKYQPKKCSGYTRLIYGRPNKCFSCEADVLKNAGPRYINYAFPTKCFSCEKESKQPYFEGPTKCFSCDRR